MPFFVSVGLLFMIKIANCILKLKLAIKTDCSCYSRFFLIIDRFLKPFQYTRCSRGNSRIVDKELIGGLRTEAENLLGSRWSNVDIHLFGGRDSGAPLFVVSMLRECFNPMTSNKNEITGTLDRKSVSRLANSFD